MTAGCVSCSNWAALVKLRNSQTVTKVRNRSVGTLVLMLSANITRLALGIENAHQSRAESRVSLQLQIEVFGQGMSHFCGSLTILANSSAVSRMGTIPSRGKRAWVASSRAAAANAA